MCAVYVSFGQLNPDHVIILSWVYQSSDASYKIEMQAKLRIRTSICQREMSTFCH